MQGIWQQLVKHMEDQCGDLISVVQLEVGVGNTAWFEFWSVGKATSASNETGKMHAVAALWCSDVVAFGVVPISWSQIQLAQRHWFRGGCPASKSNITLQVFADGPLSQLTLEADGSCKSLNQGVFKLVGCRDVVSGLVA